MPNRVHSPLVVTLALCSSRNRTMGLFILSLSVRMLFHSTACRVKQVLSIDLSSRRNTEFESIRARFSREIVATRVPFAERLAHRRCIYTLTNVIELVSKAIEVLCLNDGLNGITEGSLPPEVVLVVHVGDIIDQSKVHLSDAWAPLYRPAILLKMLRRRRPIPRRIDICSNRLISNLIGAERDPAGGAHTRVRICASSSCLRST